MNILNAVIAYKDFEWNDLSQDELAKYFVITPNEIKTNLPNVCKYEENPDLDNRIYGELSHHNYISNSIDFDWIVINQYRRRLELPDYNNIYVPKPHEFVTSVKEIYSRFHKIEDLNLMTDIIMEEQGMNNSFKLEWMKSLESNKMICYNMFSAPKDVYLDWLGTCMNLLDKFKQIKNFTNYNKVVEYYSDKDNKKTHEPYRVYGFLCERLTNCYFRWYSKYHNDIMNYNHPVCPCPIKLLEKGMIL